MNTSTFVKAYVCYLLLFGLAIAVPPLSGMQDLAACFQYVSIILAVCINLPLYNRLFRSTGSRPAMKWYCPVDLSTFLGMETGGFATSWYFHHADVSATWFVLAWFYIALVVLGCQALVRRWGYARFTAVAFYAPAASPQPPSAAGI